MATGLDRILGYAAMSVAGAVFAYYTMWIVITPFIDTDHVIQTYFLPRPYALYIPVMGGIVLATILMFITVFILMAGDKPIKYKGD